ncbi:50S ribosomal protein L15 [Patescibacteria group bacterium]|nr:50S ribosomal protein L15 [Patescibacteria group bacterium]MBU1683472.1 50S ribosomal protein L15 [Patescibacteria group bacterium]MBU1935581.1 50S ribosomal protein L15 [Patescibacteria group bacterium]
MQLNNIKAKVGATKAKKRIGRGNASGRGTYCGRGCKGQGQRKSSNVRPGFEGGQTPLIMRLPKLKGFKNPNKIAYQVANIRDLNSFNDGDEVNIEALLEKRLISKKNVPVKILGMGKLEKKLTVKIHKISTTAKEKVIKAGGKVI